MSFGSIVFTNRGKVLQSKAQAGIKLNFTKLAIGDGELGSQSVLELTDLKSKKLDIPISSLKVLTGGIASVGGTFTNQGIQSGFYWRELGLYATDPDLGEILYCYGNAGALAEYIPSSGGSQILEKFVAIETIVGNASNVSATINGSLVYATLEDIEAHNSDPTAHPDIRVMIENINVKSDVEEVVNRRLNTDTLKPLGTLISEWINAAKTAILDGIGALTTHVTNQHTNTKQHVTSARDVITNHVSQERGNTQQTVTACRDQIQGTVNLARDDIKAHVTSMANLRRALKPSNAVKSTLVSSEITSGAGLMKCLGEWVAPASGIVNVIAQVRMVTVDGTRNAYVGIVEGATSNPQQLGSMATTLYSIPTGGTKTMTTSGISTFSGVVGNSYKSVNAYIGVQQGDVLKFFTAFSGTASGYESACNLLQICYDEVSL